MIRKLMEKDAPFMLEWMHDNDINACFQKPFNNSTMETVKNFINHSFDKENQHFAIVDENDEYLGTISLKNISYENNKAEYAIVTRKCAHHKGIAKKATEELLKYAFTELNLHKIYLNVLKENECARKFYIKCGFTEQGYETDAVKINGVYRTLVWYEQLNNEKC